MIPEALESDRFIPFTAEQLKSMAAQYESGKTTYELSDIFGIDPRGVCRRLRLMGVKLRNRGNTPIFSDENCLKMVIEKESTGARIKDLAVSYGCSMKTITDALLRGRNIRSRIQ